MKTHEDDFKRFLSKIYEDEIGGCWLWTGKISEGGYGQIYLYRYTTIAKQAHRFSYEHYYGPIPEGMHVLHRCRCNNCVNPKHLFLGNQNEYRRGSGKKCITIKVENKE